MAGRKAYGIDALAKYAVNRSGAVEELSWSFYDFTTYAAAGQTQLSFFQTPSGSGGKTDGDTNMTLAGQIPAGQQFLVDRVSVEVKPTANPELAAAPGNFINDNYAALASSSFLIFNIGSKEYIHEGPLYRFPPVQRFAGASAAATTVAATTVIHDYFVATGEPFDIVPVTLTSNQNFKVTLNWPTAVATPSTATMRIGVRLHGRLYRNAQ